MTIADRVNEQWERIEKWLSANAPEVIPGLYPGAAADELDFVEKTIGAKLPEDVRAAYLRHNGADEKTASGLFGTAYFHTLARMLKDRQEFLEIAVDREAHTISNTGIRDDWYHPLWLPVAHDDSGGDQCIDLAPAEGGTLGQIIDRDRYTVETHHIANSFLDWITEFADELEDGEFVVSDQYDGGIVRYGDVFTDEEED